MVLFHSKIALDYVKAVSAIDSNNYPESLGTMFIINAPRAFSAIWRMIKGWLDPRTVSKIHIYSKKSDWLPVLLEHIDVESLPEEIGGQAKNCFDCK